MESEEPEFLLELRPPREGISRIGQAMLDLSQGAERLGNEDRSFVNHVSGRPENVAEHSNMLSIIAAAIAEEFYPDLDENLVARYASIHDLVEAYVGDTPTNSITKQGQLDKEELERLGLEKLKQDYAHLPKFVAFVVSYEEQIIPEARFVRVVDKCMPAMMHFLDDGATLRSYVTSEEVLENSAERAAELRAEYPEYEELIVQREEFSEHMANKFL